MKWEGKIEDKRGDEVATLKLSDKNTSKPTHPHEQSVSATV